MQRFSVLMSVYIKENPSYLEAALQSLCEQTLKADEIVLVEDGPLTDSLYSVIEKFRPILPLRSVPLETNLGLAGALNHGLQHCSHDIIARMDTDDFSLPRRFKAQVEFMTQHLNVAACSSYIEERSEDMTRITFVKKLPLEHSELVEFAKTRSPMSHPAVMFRKSAVLAVGGYPIIYPEDYPLWCKLISFGYKLANIPEVLLHMRAGNGMMSRRGKNFLKGYIQTYQLMYDLKMISYFTFARNVILQTVIRNMPGWLLKVLYRYAR